jgi:hypothetical protein
LTRREWTWDHRRDGVDGCVFDGAQLHWYSANWAAPYADAAGSQGLDEFLRDGPASSDVPPEIIAEITEVVRAHVAAGGPA